MNELAEKVVLVTGAARGQGRAHAVRLARAGAKVVALDMCRPVETIPYDLSTSADLQDTKELIEREGSEALIIQADVRDAPAVEAAFDRALKEFGRLDVVLANAGVCPELKSAWEFTPEAFQTIIDINLIGVANTLRAAASRMLKQGTGGAIVVTGSGASVKAMAMLAPYVAAKHAIVGLSRGYARELAPHGIRVNMVHPGNVGSPMLVNEYMKSAFLPDVPEATYEQFAERASSSVPLGIPWLDPAEISEAVLWLVSDAAKHVTGVAIPVDAGQSIP